MDNIWIVTIIGGVVVLLIGYYVFGIGKSNSGDVYNVSSKNQTGGMTAGKIEISNSRNLFSQTQSIKTQPTGLGGNRLLNLDNVATLRLRPPYSLNNATLILDVVSQTLPDYHSKTTDIIDFQYYNQSTGTHYIFDTGEHKRHEIRVGGRVFIVTLFKIIKLDIANTPEALEYQFGISER